MKSEKVEAILSYLHDNYDDAKTALDFTNDYECLVSIILSAQTTDKSVNKAGEIPVPTVQSGYAEAIIA